MNIHLITDYYRQFHFTVIKYSQLLKHLLIALEYNELIYIKLVSDQFTVFHDSQKKFMKKGL